MSRFRKLPAFEKEFTKLVKKYKSLPQDLADLETLLLTNPVGFGNNFVTIHQTEEIRIVKTRLACKSLRERSLRVIYAFHGDRIEFVFIEIYFKGTKANEDRVRIEEYIKNAK